VEQVRTCYASPGHQSTRGFVTVTKWRMVAVKIVRQNSVVVLWTWLLVKRYGSLSKVEVGSDEKQ